jgi:Cof subfamily protein (haloacid dehalogenase superfamily)
MSFPGLVASDLDGTLLNRDGQVTDRTIDALDRLDAAGIPFVMVTGRPIRWLASVLATTGPRGPVVCSNGAVVYDPARDQVLRRQPISVELLAEVAERLRAEYPKVLFAAESERGMRHEHRYPARFLAGDPGVHAADLAAVLAEPAVKLLARVDGPTLDDLTGAMGRSLRGLVEVTRSSGDGLVEISASGVTKATGLAWVADRYGVPPEDILAFGDMPNDLPMFAFAGRGVAMANAEPAVRAAASDTTTGNDADGVASYLDNILDAVTDGR